MREFSPIGYAIGLVLTVAGMAMVLPMFKELLDGSSDTWQPFLLAAALTIATGLSLCLAFQHKKKDRQTAQQSLFLMVAIWIVVPVFGSLPFLFAESPLSITDSIFESMSGFTTTGSTILDNLDAQSQGTLLWRGLLQWMGGMGVVIAAMVFLPQLGIGGMQLFRGSMSQKSGAVHLRTSSVFRRIVLVYLLLTALCGGAYLAFGMTSFEAIVHAMTTIATGGFGTRDDSFAEFNAPIQYSATFFMILASLPFIHYAQLLTGRIRPLLRDSQIRAFLAIAAVAALALAAWQIPRSDTSLEETFRTVLFNSVSVMTGTGYASTNYSAWGGFAVTLFFLLGMIGGCSNSTTCSIKVFRFQVLAAALITEIRRISSPQAVLVPRYQGEPVSPDVISSVTGMLFLFIVSLVLLTTLLSMTGLDLTTAASGAATALANVGPGLGSIIGPDGNFATLSDTAKWLLIAGMLLGRLEILCVLALFQISFWRT